jgi:hypothetical protein
MHFSGHSNDDLVVFEDDEDAPHEGVIVTARAFAKAIQATDDPPLLVLLNSCKSTSQIDDLVAQVVPFAIGMADSIDDGDAINSQAALELAGLDGAELPTLAWAADVDRTATILVKPTEAA